MIICKSDVVEVSGSPTDIIDEVATVICSLIKIYIIKESISAKKSRDLVFSLVNEAVDIGYHSILHELISKD